MDAIVIGGGPAGLIAATRLAAGGAGVTLLEAKSRLGGRAASDAHEGFILNQGPHALYLGGAARRELKALGIDPPGALPRAVGVRVVRDGAARRMTFPPKVAKLFRTDPAGVEGLTALQWLERDVPTGSARDLARALLHIATYTGPLDRLSADAAVRQARIVLRGVRYLHGGWDSLVGALAGAARARGAVLRTGAAVRSIEPGWTVATDDEELRADVVIVATGGPERASRLLGTEIAAPGPEAEASVLDIGLDRLPHRFRRFATSYDAPRYLSVHSPPARLAPDGGVLAGVASYGRAPREDLEAFTDAVQPGWRERARMTRYLPAMTVITAIPTPETGGLAGRPGPEVAPGAFVAGDWVGPEGLLVDAALASGAAAARAALRSPVRERAAAA